MLAKRKSDGKQIEVTRAFGGYYESDGELYSKADLDFLPEKETAAIEGYVARDGNGDLYFYDHKPMRDDEDMDFVEQNGDAWFLHKGLNFPSVTWQSEPKKVRIKIEEI